VQVGTQAPRPCRGQGLPELRYTGRLLWAPPLPKKAAAAGVAVVAAFSRDRCRLQGLREGAGTETAALFGTAGALTGRDQGQLAPCTALDQHLYLGGSTCLPLKPGCGRPLQQVPWCPTFQTLQCKPTSRPRAVLRGGQQQLQQAGKSSPCRMTREAGQQV